jgi:Domain of unknown function (DUF4282)
VADVMRTCASCGNTQATGDFCEKCGTRMPAAAAAEGAAAAYSAGYQAPPVPGAYQPGAYQPGAYQPGAAPPYAYGAQPQYAYPREPSPWSKLFDLSFQGFVTAASLKVLYFITLGLMALFFVFSIVWGFMFTGKIGAMWLFVTIALTGLMFFGSRMLFELMATNLRIRENTEKKAETKS